MRLTLRHTYQTVWAEFACTVFGAGLTNTRLTSGYHSLTFSLCVEPQMKRYTVVPDLLECHIRTLRHMRYYGVSNQGFHPKMHQISTGSPTVKRLIESWSQYFRTEWMHTDFGQLEQRVLSDLSTSCQKGPLELYGTIQDPVPTRLSSSKISYRQSKSAKQDMFRALYSGQAYLGNSADYAITGES